jgi:protein-S-isoprenylcysteine O-methyltransferase Ste14
MNKNGQYYQQPQQTPFGGAHPVLIIGIIIFVIPFFNTTFGWHLPKWINGIGVILIIIGSLLSIVKVMDR